VSYTYLAAPFRARNSILRSPFDLLRARSPCRKKKRTETRQRSLSPQCDWILTPRIELSGDLSGPRRRVNQTENDRRLSSSYKFRRFDLSTVDHAYPDTSKLLPVCFTRYLLPRKNFRSIIPSSSLDLSTPENRVNLWKHVNSIKTLRRLFLSRSIHASPYLPSRLLDHNGNFFFW